MKQSLIVLNEATAQAVFAGLGFKKNGDETVSEWARRMYESGAFRELPPPQKADRPHNKALLDFLKSILNARDLPFNWSPARRKTSFQNYPMTDTHKQLSIIELAILALNDPLIFRHVDGRRQPVTPSHLDALEKSGTTG